MRVFHVSYSDTMGGASRAAFRINQALNRKTAVESKMLVRARYSHDESVLAFPHSMGPLSSPKRLFRRMVSKKREKKWSEFSAPDNTYFSRADIQTDLLTAITNQQHDIIHLHWMGKDTLSIEEIGQINKPVVWTLHDMWPFCGAEHYVPDVSDARFKVGYKSDNRPEGETGLDMNRSVWERKMVAWKSPMTIVCPSLWLAGCARASALFKTCQIVHIPYPLDIETWHPQGQKAARALLGIPEEGKLVVLFGAIGGETDLRKGADLLHEAMQILSDRGEENLHLVVFGQSEPERTNSLPYPVTYLGRLQEDMSMLAAYNAADLMVVPSRQDNLPLTAMEAQACGVPVVAFNIGGLPEIIEHQRSGCLAVPFDTGALADSIAWVLTDPDRRRALGEAARAKVLKEYSEAVIAQKYASLYEQVLNKSRKRQ